MRLSISLAALAATLALGAPAPAAAQPGTYHGSLTQCANGQSLQLRAGQRYVISASSDSFDTVLRILRRGATDILANDDDGGDGLNSRLTFSPAESGDYIACVTSWNGAGAGDYTLTVENAPPLPAPATRPTRTETATWQVFDGTLADGDGEDNGSRFDDYLVTIPTGQRAIISADSTGFDTVVKVYRANDRGGDPAASDDDSGGNLNSLLVFSPDEGGDFIVRVTSYSSGSSGAYHLRITQSATPPRPADNSDAENEAQGD
jgi:hypothetical protein